MRFVLFTFGLGIGLTLTSCARTPLDSSPIECGDGQVACGAACVPAGTCAPASNGGAGGTSAGKSGGSTGANTGTGGSSTPPSTSCTDVASLQRAMSQRYDGTFVTVDGSTKQYFVQSNWWSLYEQQTVTVSGLSYTLGNPTGAASSNDAPMGYPSFFIGSYAGHTTDGSNLPKQVSVLTKVPTLLSTNAMSMGTSNYNAAYDVWFTATGTPLPSYQYNPGTGGAYLMVWLFKPTDRQPRGGAPAYGGQKVVGLPGTWDVWIDNSDPPCISYVSTTPVERLDFDLNSVIQDGVKNGYGITSSMYLSIIFGGFEVWGGGDGLQLKAFCASVL